MSGIDAAEGMIAIARRRVPDGDLRVGAMEDPPWRDDSFDVVTGFNAWVPFQAPDQETLERALLAPGGVAPAIEHAGEEAVRKEIAEAAEPFRHADGS